ncbi:MAG: protease modulator HflC [Alphaproteobacteria bacterium]|jgi:membrane protease subunit HflC|nr:protease modulator HflC [Candidatus Jidaibacter sp.]
MNRILIGVVASLFILYVLLDGLYILDQRKSALVLQLGQPVKYETEPGLKFKLPLLQNLIFFDKRIQNLAADTTEVIASDQKTMRVDAFTKYKIIDGLKFYQSAKDDRGFKARLAPILDSSLRQVLGGYQFRALLSDDRAHIMVKIKDIVNKEAADFGIQVIDVRIMRADLPDKSREAVYDRMRSEREKEAKEIRAEGGEQAQKIIATAEKDKLILLAEAKKKGEILRGEGDSEAIRSFALSFGKDPEFFDFYRSLQAYRKSISKDNSRVILSTDSEFMKYFKKN